MGLGIVATTLRLSALVALALAVGAARASAEEDVAARRADTPPPGLSLGSKRGSTLEVAASVWFARLAPTSDFQVGPHEVDDRQPFAWIADLGSPESLVIPGLSATLGLGGAGWLGAELVVVGFEGGTGVARGPRRSGDLELAANDVVRARARVLTGSFRYGYELRWRFFPDADVPLDLFASPALGVGVYRLDAAVRRIYPTISPLEHARFDAWTIAPGVRAGVELLDAFRLVVELEWLPYKGFHVTRPFVDRWERVRLYVAFRLPTFPWAEATVGWRYGETSVEGARRAADLKVSGVEIQGGFRF